MPSSSKTSLRIDIREATNKLYKIQGFLTDHDIREIWSEARRAQILSHNFLGFPNNTPETSQKSFLKARLKILLILIDIHWSDWNDCFLSLTNERVDTALPLDYEDLVFLQQDSYRDTFQKRQWRFLPPVIKEHTETQAFPSQTKFPFSKPATRSLGTGSSGKVFEESIPPGHFRYVNGEVNKVSRQHQRNDVKRYRLRVDQTIKRVARKLFTREDHETEIKNLLNFHQSSVKHDAIMKYLAFLVNETVKGEKQHCILMDMADSDLNHFLPYGWDVADHTEDPDTANPKTLSTTKATMRDLLFEMAELAGAMDWLHNSIQVPGEILACCHMDLKPSNILLFGINDSPVGKWKIADFGISAVRTPKSKGPDSQALKYLKETIITSAKRNPGPYTAPEVRNNPLNIGRNSDIWSYGCILVEVIASRMTGRAYLKELTVSRGLGAEGSHSYDWFHREDALNPSVQAWLEDLDKPHYLEDPADSAALRECRKLLEEILVDKRDRPNGKIIRERLINAYRTIPAGKSTSGSWLPLIDREKGTPQPIRVSTVERSFQKQELEKLSPLDERAEADTMLLSEMQEWILAPQAQLFWFERPLNGNLRDVSPICSSLLRLAQNEGMFVAIYLCRQGPGPGAIKRTKRDLLSDLTHSLIYQLQSYMNTPPISTQPVIQRRFDDLRGTDTLANAITVFADLCASFPTRWFCIIDGFDLLDDFSNNTLEGHVQSLLGALRPFGGVDGAGDKNFCKIIVTSFGSSPFRRKLSVDHEWSENFSSGNLGFVVDEIASALRSLKWLD